MNKLRNTFFAFLAAFSLLANATDGDYEEGFLTSHLNRVLERQMGGDSLKANERSKRFGRNLTDYVSAPNFGGYILGRYSYTDQRGKHGGNGFDCQFIRAYVSGTLLKDFHYRVQMELRGTPFVRDYTIEWKRFTWFQVKVGQFKRTFTYDNQIGPWLYGFGQASQVSRALCASGLDDPNGELSQGGRDAGLQLHGSLFSVGNGRHHLFHYQGTVMNGNGMNKSDNNGKKDWMGSVRLEPLKNLCFEVYGWHGTYTKDDITVKRDRYAVSAWYEKDGWMVRAEYAHHSGHNVKDFDSTNGTWSGRGKADGWYVQTGAPCTSWLQTFVRYDVYRREATWGSQKTIWSICPNFQLHKNLKFTLQYNYVSDRTNPADRHYNELTAVAWIRF